MKNFERHVSNLLKLKKDLHKVSREILIDTDNKSIAYLIKTLLGSIDKMIDIISKDQ